MNRSSDPTTRVLVRQRKGHVYVTVIDHKNTRDRVRFRFRGELTEETPAAILSLAREQSASGRGIQIQFLPKEPSVVHPDGTRVYTIFTNRIPLTEAIQMIEVVYGLQRPDNKTDI